MVKEAVRAAGGVPFEFNTIGVDDGIIMGHEGMRYSLPSRELIVDPSQGILARVQNLITTQLISGGAAAPGIQLPLTVHIVYKSMVPRAIG